MTISTGNTYLDALSSTTSKAAAAATAVKSKSTIDQSGFLKLLTTQLKTQDPTAPVDNGQMAAQMAQFSTVAGISEMNTSLKAMAGDVTTSRFGAASGLIGRGALVKSDVSAAMSNGTFAGEITLPADAKDVTLTLVDGTGQTVYAKDLGAKSAGAVDWAWDGKDSAGAAVAGPLQVVVGAAGSSGSSLATTSATWAEVQSVQSPASGTTKLITTLGSFAPADVLQLG